MVFIYDLALDQPVVNPVNEEQCFSWVFVMDGSTNFFYGWWKTKAAESLGIARHSIVSTKSPDLSTCKQRQVILRGILSMDAEIVSVIVV